MVGHGEILTSYAYDFGAGKKSRDWIGLDLGMDTLKDIIIGQ